MVFYHYVIMTKHYHHQLPCTIVVLLVLSTYVHTIIHCPASCWCNSMCTIVSCTKSQLRIIPPLPSSTLDLRLSSNRIRLLYNHSLYTAPRTRLLDLRHNDLVQIHSGAFKILRDLHTLLLSHNQLTYLSPGMFISNSHLHILDLNHNIITGKLWNSLIWDIRAILGTI